MTDAEYFTALKRGAAKGDVIAAWNLADAYAEGYVLRENGAWFSVRRNRALAERLYRFVAKTRMRDVVLSLASVQSNINDMLRLERKAWRMGVKEKEARRLFGLGIRRNWGTPDDQECAAQFIKMIDRGETPHPPRRGKTIGSIRPVLITWKSRRRVVE